MNHDSSTTKKHGCRTGCLAVLIIFVLLPAGLFFALPALLSHDAVRVTVVRRVQDRGVVFDVTDWSFSWFGASYLEGVTFRAHGDEFSVAIDHIEIPSGLLGIVRRRGDFGEIIITAMNLDVQLPEPPPEPPLSEAPADFPSEPPLPQETLQPDSPAALEEMRVPPLPLRGVVRIIDSRITMRGSLPSDPLTIDPLSITMYLHGPEQRVELILDGSQQHASGTLTFNTSTEWSEGGFSAVGTLDINSWELLPISRLAAGMGAGVSFEGQLSGRAVMEMSAGGSPEHEVSGDLLFDLNDVKLGGPMLKGDAPVFEKIRILTGIVVTEKKLRIEDFSFSSPVLMLDVQGDIQAARIGAVPRMNLRVFSGLDIAVLTTQLPKTLNLQPGVNVEEGSFYVQVSVTNHVEGSYVTVSAQTTPVRAALNGQPVVWDSPFTLDGAMRLTESLPVIERLTFESAFAQADVTGDENRLDVHLDLDVSKLYGEAAGLLALPFEEPSGKLQLRGHVLTPLAQERSVHVGTTITGVKIPLGEHVIAQDRMGLTFDFIAAFTAEGVLQQIRTLRATWQADAIATTVAIDQLGWIDSPAFPQIPRFLVHGEANLEHLLQEMRNAGIATNVAALAGMLTLEATGGLSDGLLTLRDADIRIQDFLFAPDEFGAYRDEELSLGVRGEYEFTRKRVQLSELKLSTRPCSLIVSGTGQQLDDSVRLNAEGRVMVDYDALDPLLQTLLPDFIRVSGRDEKMFRVAGTISESGDLSGLDADFSLMVPQAQAYGLHFQHLRLDVPLRSGIASPAIEADVNQGRLELRPVIDFTGRYPDISLPPGARILQHVRVDRDVAEAILAKIHPVFRGSQDLNGLLDVELDQLEMSLDPARREDMLIAGRILLQDVTVAADGVLAAVLSLARIEDTRLDVVSHELTFRTENGRIVPSPLVVGGGVSRLTFSGSVGLDGSLDYGADIPVTRRLVGDRAYPYLRDTSLRLAVGGTVDAPVLDRDSFNRAVQRVAAQAVENVIKDQLKEQGGQLLRQLLAP